MDPKLKHSTLQMMRNVPGKIAKYYGEARVLVPGVCARPAPWVVLIQNSTKTSRPENFRKLQAQSWLKTYICLMFPSGLGTNLGKLILEPLETPGGPFLAQVGLGSVHRLSMSLCPGTGVEASIAAFLIGGNHKKWGAVGVSGVLGMVF